MRYTTDEIRLKNMVTEGLKQKPSVKFGDVTLVRIPKIKGRTRALEPNKQGTYNIEYIHERWYDPEIRQCRNRKVVIGCVMEFYPDAMLPNENYYEYFDIKTGLPKETEENKEEENNTEAQAEEAPGKEETPKAEEAPKEEAPWADELPKEEMPSAAKQTASKERTKKKSREKKGTDREDDKKLMKVLRDIQKFDPNWEERSRLFGEGSRMDEVINQTTEGTEEGEMEKLYAQIQIKKERATILKYILREVLDSIRDQAKRHPEGLVSPYKVKKINALLIEIRVRYEGSGYEDLLELLEEPREYEKDGQKYITGMSYSDAEILLSHYTQVMSSIQIPNRKKVKRLDDLTTLLT